VLELHPKGYGFLRNPEQAFRPSSDDPYVSASLIEKLGLRAGNLVEVNAQRSSKQGPRVTEIVSIEGRAPEAYERLESFEELTSINPESQLKLETGREPVTTRVMDLFTPLGKGQRALIVAPPRSGKTILMQEIGQAVGQNNPEVKVMVLLIDERPEEVTDMRRSIPGEVCASSRDQEVESHVRLAQLVVERCKRMAEAGEDVLVLVDSLTRISRAFNKKAGDSGRTMTGGLDIRALDIPKKLFASARALEEGGSLTIVATALVKTGSRMDDAIFEEFKGTGNMDIALDQQLAERRIWPAIDLSQSGTRRDEKLLDPATLQAVTRLRRTLGTMHPADAMQRLVEQLRKHESNYDYLMSTLGG